MIVGKLSLNLRVDATFRNRSIRRGLIAAIAVLAFILLFPQTLFSQTTVAYSENFDSYAAGTRLTAAQTGGSSYYVSGPPSGGGDNARISGPWETANTTLGAQNPTPFLMFWTEINGPAIPTTTAGQCGRHSLPKLQQIQSLKDFLKNFPADRHLFLADENAKEHGGDAVAAAVAAHPGPAAFLIGSEGGFTDEARRHPRASANRPGIARQLHPARRNGSDCRDGGMGGGLVVNLTA